MLPIDPANLLVHTALAQPCDEPEGAHLATDKTVGARGDSKTEKKNVNITIRVAEGPILGLVGASARKKGPVLET